MRAPTRAYRGFTLIELIAVIVIIAILAAVALPRMTAASPFTERGYVDAVIAHLRQARIVAVTSGCEVRFRIDSTGFYGEQRGADGTHCRTNGGWATPVFSEIKPADVFFAGNQQLVFSIDGNLASPAGPVDIDIGTRQITVEPSGLVVP
jgi:prepilin-type N-terminal cleavage/methylation domain-containing protein